MSDFRDTRGGAYDHVSEVGNPQPPQVKDKATLQQRAQWGADVRPEPLPGPDEGYPLPEGLRKRRMGPLNKDTGRRPKGQGGLWAASARISATVAGTNNAELLLDKLLMAKREKKLDTSG